MQTLICQWDHISVNSAVIELHPKKFDRLLLLDVLLTYFMFSTWNNWVIFNGKLTVSGFPEYLPPWKEGLLENGMQNLKDP